MVPDLLAMPDQFFDRQPGQRGALRRSGCVGGCSSFDSRPLGQFDLRNRVAVHFIGAVDDAHGALMGVRFGQPEIAADARRAVRLNGPVDHLARHVRGHHLDHRDLGARRLVAGHVHHMGRVQRQ